MKSQKDPLLAIHVSLAGSYKVTVQMQEILLLSSNATLIYKLSSKARLQYASTAGYATTPPPANCDIVGGITG